MKGHRLAFDFASLQAFVQVCEAGTMLRAAHQLGLTQSAVSQIVKQLEGALGVTLFDRSIRPLGLTPAGAMLRMQAQKLLTEAGQIGPGLRQIARTRLLMLRIGVTESVARILAPSLATEIATLAARTSVRTGIALSQTDALFKRQLDLIVSVDPLEDVEGLDRFLLVEEPFVLLVPARLARLRTPEALAASGLPFLSYADHSFTGMSVDRYLRRSGVKLDRNQDFDSSRVITEMVSAGQGWTITTPLCIAGARIDRRGVTILPLPPPGMRRSLTLTARSRELGGIPERLAATCRRVLREEVWPELRPLVPWLALGRQGPSRLYIPA